MSDRFGQLLNSPTKNNIQAVNIHRRMAEKGDLKDLF
jgi:hypothetical protein